MGDDMKTLAVTVNKGGVGKTMLAKSLGTAAWLSGLNVLILDMDTQQNSTKWGRRRAELQSKPLPLVRFTTEGDLEDEMTRARQAGCDLVIIDTPPGRSSEASPKTWIPSTVFRKPPGWRGRPVSGPLAFSIARRPVAARRRKQPAPSWKLSAFPWPP
jgi:cellulose biosynthesis protein BcsQ